MTSRTTEKPCTHSHSMRPPMLSSEMIKMMKPAGFIILIISLESIGGRIEWLWVQGFSVVRDVIGVPRG